MSAQIVSECRCRECGQPLDVQRQADGKGSSFPLVTCWIPDCGLRTVTRSLESYLLLTESELQIYRETNRVRDEVCNG
jgi:hypothetical protein